MTPETIEQLRLAAWIVYALGIPSWIVFFYWSRSPPEGGEIGLLWLSAIVWPVMATAISIHAFALVVDRRLKAIFKHSRRKMP